MKDPNILLIDDDKVYLFFMTKVIKNITDKLEIQICTDGEQAVEFFENLVDRNGKVPEVIFLDINMPFLDGWGFLEEFKKLKSQLITKELNIYMVSSSAREQDIERAKQFEELTGYYVKPVKQEDLKSIFEEVYENNW